MIWLPFPSTGSGLPGEVCKRKRHCNQSIWRRNCGGCRQVLIELIEGTASLISLPMITKTNGLFPNSLWRVYAFFMQNALLLDWKTQLLTTSTLIQPIAGYLVTTFTGLTPLVGN